MKIYLTQLLQNTPDPAAGKHLMREYLQARILSSLQRVGAMIPLAFHGGTALRFLYQIPRYSEGLDFALEQAQQRYNFRAYLRAIQSDLTAEGYPVELKLNDQRVEHSAFVRFPGLLHELDLSPHPQAIFSIKLEVDTQPPVGAKLETTIVRRYLPLHLQHHDRASLLAGKLHAMLMRPHTKGRDLYDLLWYLSSPEWPSPNLIFLNNALEQTDWSGPLVTEDNWQVVIWNRLSVMDLEKAIEDVQPFLMDPPSAALLTKENLIKLLQIN